MTSIETAGSQGSGSEISATPVSRRERFEAVLRGEIQRVGRRLGNLSPDLLVDLAFRQSADPYGSSLRSRRYWRKKSRPIMRNLESRSILI
jgi:hypothetical protein